MRRPGIGWQKTERGGTRESEGGREEGRKEGEGGTEGGTERG